MKRNNSENAKREVSKNPVTQPGAIAIPILFIIFLFAIAFSGCNAGSTVQNPIRNSDDSVTHTEVSVTDRTIKTIQAVVIRVVDGDTIHVRLITGQKETVRLIGVDTPETHHPTKPVQYYGREAENFTRSQLAGKTVWLEKDVQERDKYGRLLAYVWVSQPVEQTTEQKSIQTPNRTSEQIKVQIPGQTPVQTSKEAPGQQSDLQSKVDDRELRTKLFNARLLLDGYAYLLTIPPDVKYADEYFVKFQREAREKHRGLWQSLETTDTLSEAITSNALEAPNKINRLNKMNKQNARSASATHETGNNALAAGKFVGSMKSNIYHYPNCQKAKRISPSNLIWFSSAEDARLKGYRPCRECNPR